MPRDERHTSAQRSTARAGRTRRTGRSNRRTRSLLSQDMAQSESPPRRARVARLNAVVHALPRAQEYAFIRSDLRRLLLTAAVVTVLMLAMLIVLD